MRLNLHARIEIALVATLLLASCNGSEFKSKFSDVEQDEIGDIAGDIAYDVVTEHEKVKDLERRVSELERRLSM